MALYRLVLLFCLLSHLHPKVIRMFSNKIIILCHHRAGPLVGCQEGLKPKVKNRLRLSKWLDFPKTSKARKYGQCWPHHEDHTHVQQQVGGPKNCHHDIGGRSRGQVDKSKGLSFWNTKPKFINVQPDRHLKFLRARTKDPSKHFIDNKEHKLCYYM